MSTPGRTIAIGDVHGCAKALAALLRVVDPQPADKIITLGDYIDRGPDSRGAMDQLLELTKNCRLIPILGNHDKMLLEILAGKQHMLSNWWALGGNTTMRSFGCPSLERIPEKYISFLLNCRPWYESATHLFVHANYMCNLPLAEQPSYVLRWESLKVRCPPPHYSGKIAIIGHTSQRNGNILEMNHLKCIDTYCYGGGWLTALDVETGQTWQTSERGRLRQKILTT